MTLFVLGLIIGVAVTAASPCKNCDRNARFVAAVLVADDRTRGGGLGASQDFASAVRQLVRDLALRSSNACASSLATTDADARFVTAVREIVERTLLNLRDSPMSDIRILTDLLGDTKQAHVEIYGRPCEPVKP